MILGVPLGPQVRPGTSQELTRILYFFINFQLRLKTGPDGLREGPREAPGIPAGTPRVPFEVDF